jgi:parallel beta-helix repeat protein
LIGWGSSGNRVTGNRIYRIQQSGISFEGNNSFNNIIANKISCQTGVDCLVVSVGDPPLSTTNKVQGNKFIR